MKHLTLRTFCDLAKKINITSLRLQYMKEREILLENNIPVKDPICVFRDWLQTAILTEEILEPKAACLATVSKKGCPSNRYMMLKEVTPHGFKFFTNCVSEKISEVNANPNVALTFYWAPLRRQVRIEGVVEELGLEESLAYFHNRPRFKQIGALASEQSIVIPSRQFLDEVQDEIKKELGPTKEIPLPNWCGYLIRPNVVEFWQGHINCFYDRIRFRSGVEEEADGELVHRGDNGWVYERLAP